MSDKTLTRAQLAEALQKEMGASRQQAAALVESVLGLVSDALVNGDQVKLSSFGAFGLRDKGSRMGRNPKTGVEAAIPPRRVLVFKPSQILRERVDKALSR